MKKKHVVLIKYIIIILFFILASYIVMNSFIGFGISRGITYIQSRVYGLSILFAKKSDSLKSKSVLIEENKDLRELLMERALDEIEQNKIKQENDILRSMLAFKKEYKKIRTLEGLVIGRDVLNKNILHINRGSKDGLKKGLAVISHGGILVGLIIDVKKTFSKMLLLVDNRSEVAGVFVYEPIDKIISGYRNIGMIMNLIPINTNVKRGDVVLSSGLEEFIPRGLYIGTVVKVFSEKGKAFKSAIIASPINSNHIETVSIILSKNEDFNVFKTP